ncbi:hypothetical protein EUX98_g4653 [Antrodiella citrinella]|uniref:Aminotransferase class V domain-containing protein n=1 Tax=Antrodiella citrinella TaxID=2447956 RepID=A0A4S4MW84_9APHY|nr:hypothetical protein EUX98_g4653 [Antrodiella citrinella]
MGNTSSSSSLPVIPPSYEPKLQNRHVIKHKRSNAAFSALTLGCASASDYPESLPSSQDSTVADREEKLSFDPPPLYAYSTHDLLEDVDASSAYKSFLKTYPGYTSTWILDALRRSDFGRLDRAGETYVDYMGGSLYPESLIRVHTDFLHQNILGNTHSINNASKLSSDCAEEARQAVLSFFRAPAGYTVVFTANASAALKLVGEAFPFAEGSSYVLGADSHNSVHGIRQYAKQRGAQVHYIESTPTGGVDASDAKTILAAHRPPTNSAASSLFALTGQSNVSNSKNPLSLIRYASSLGYNTLLDAAALAPTSVVSLAETPVDAMAVSFYKMFGFPTGVGALVVRESFLAKLERPWFAGGTVDVVQAPGNVFTLASEMHERFEDGTINYLNLPAVTQGLRFLSAYLPFLPLRLSNLTHYLTSALSELKHEHTGTPVVRVLSRIPGRKLKSVGDQSDAGSTISFIFLTPTGEQMPLSFIEHAASRQNVSLRTGCMCNPGGAAALLGLRSDMDRLYPGVTMKEFEQHVGYELGVVRVSLGLASNFQDVYRVVKFASSMGEERCRRIMWRTWSDEKIGTAL